MADWKTYAKAARNTARKQAPGAKDAARRASRRAGDYARAAGRAIDEGRRDDAPHRSEASRELRDEDRDRHDDHGERDDRDLRDRGPARDRRPPAARERSRGDGPRTATAPRPPLDSEKLRKDAAAYYTVASRRVASAGLIPRVMRALRDALLIGLSLFVIWGVLYVAGIPIPFTTVVIIVLLIVVISFASGLYAQSRRAREAREDPGA